MSVIYDGKLHNRKTAIDEPFHVRPLAQEHLPQIMNVQERVYEQMEVKELLQTLSVEEFEYILTGNGLILGVFVDGQLVGFRSLLYPGDDEENLGIDLGLSAEEQMKVVHQEITCVLPEYRGNRLQKLLAKLIMEVFHVQGNKHHHLCCTVYPFNYPSLKDKLAQGMLITKVKDKYGNLLRYILYQNLKDNLVIDWETLVAVPSDDLEQQKALLNQGYYGYDLRETNGEMMLRFGKVRVE